MKQLPLPDINHSLLEMVGNTPLLEIKNIDVGLCSLFVKMESQNPGGSIKDRVAMSIIEQAEADGTKASIHSFRLLRRFLTKKYSIFEE